LICSGVSIGSSSFIRADRLRDQEVVLYKIPAGRRQLFGKPGLRKKLRCSLQDRPLPAQRAKPLRRNTLDPELRCSLQGWSRDAADPAGAVACCFAQRPQGAFANRSSDRRRARPAIASGCHEPPAHIADQSGSFAGGSRRGDAAGTRLGCKRAAGVGKVRVGMLVGSKGSGVWGSRRLLRSFGWH